MSEILNIENLNKSFDGVAPVKDVSFAVSKHSIVLITGENGAGKTTLFNLITGLEKPHKGKSLSTEKTLKQNLLCRFLN
jgi:ABC-type branched-subunit amino acid transport system ATPase component